MRPKLFKFDNHEINDGSIYEAQFEGDVFFRQAEGKVNLPHLRRFGPRLEVAPERPGQQYTDCAGHDRERYIYDSLCHVITFEINQQQGKSRIRQCRISTAWRRWIRVGNRHRPLTMGGTVFVRRILGARLNRGQSRFLIYINICRISAIFVMFL